MDTSVMVSQQQRQLTSGCSSPIGSTTSNDSSSYSNLSPMQHQVNRGAESEAAAAVRQARMSDEDLAQLSVRELNQRLQGHDRKVVSALKQKRRTLKNRGYALNCRVRRLQLQLQLEAENVMLKNEIRCLRQMLHDVQTRLAYYEGTIPVSQQEHSTVSKEEYYPHEHHHQYFVTGAQSNAASDEHQHQLDMLPLLS